MEDITFKELYNKTNQNLIIGVTNVSTNEFETWNYQNKPNMSVIDAVNISCNIPIIFNPIKIQQHYFVDGGLINNFPIDIFTSQELNNTIGIVCNNKYYHKFNNFLEYINNIIFSIITNSDSAKIKLYSNLATIIYLDSNDHFLDFNLNQDEIKNKINYGYQSATNFFNNKYKNLKIKRSNTF